MRLLVLGGGGFLGYHLVDRAVAAGHEVTSFTRSGRAPDGVQGIAGDRTGDLGELAGREWDACVDTFSDPDAVRSSALALSGRVGAYGYVSGMSVYDPTGPSVPDETAPVRTPGGPGEGDPLQERSIAKLACERAVTEGFAGAVLTVRVGIMVGPRDPTDRFSWWPARFARALAGHADRRVLAPGDPARPVQYSDARDIASWAVDMLATGRGGLFNTVGPIRSEPLAAVLGQCVAAAGGSPGEVELVWVEEDALDAALPDVEQESRPLWFPEDQIPQAAIDSTAAAEAGLAFRPAADTARDVLAELRATGRLTDLRAGLPADRERHLLGTLPPAVVVP